MRAALLLLIASVASAQPTLDSVEAWRASVPDVPLLAVDERGDGTETWWSGDHALVVTTTRIGESLFEQHIALQNPKYHADVVRWTVTEGAEKPDDWPTEWPPTKNATSYRLRNGAAFVQPTNFAADFVCEMVKTPDSTVELTDWQEIAPGVPLYTAGVFQLDGGDRFFTLQWDDLPTHSKKECYLSYYGLPEPDQPVNWVAWWLAVVIFGSLACWFACWFIGLFQDRTP